MIIVLIHWKIKPDKIEDFKSWWGGPQADIEERSGLSGEFLSEPMSLDELKKDMPVDHASFAVNELAPPVGEAPYKSFVNVGLWQSWGDFYNQVGKNFNDERPMKEFEQARRTRTILKPTDWRIGQWHLPTSDLTTESNKQAS